MPDVTQTAAPATAQDSPPNADAKAVAADKAAAPAKETLVVPSATPEPSKAEAQKGDAATEAKPADAAKPEDGKKQAAPETPELKLSEDYPFDAADVKELGLDQKRADKLAEMVKTDRAALLDAQKAALEKKSREWVDEVKADKEIGGDNFPKNVELAKRFVARYGSDALKKALNETGLGNHPELVRMLSKAAQAMQDDTLVVPGAQSASRPKAAEEVMFPLEELQPKESA